MSLALLDSIAMATVVTEARIIPKLVNMTVKVLLWNCKERGMGFWWRNAVLDGKLKMRMR